MPEYRGIPERAVKMELPWRYARAQSPKVLNRLKRQMQEFAKKQAEINALKEKSDA
jgi:hypothetical protein